MHRTAMLPPTAAHPGVDAAMSRRLPGGAVVVCLYEIIERVKVIMCNQAMNLRVCGEYR